VINLKNVATITFPDTPKINISSQDTVFTTVNNGAIYLAGAMNAQKSFKELLTKHVLDSMYNGVISGTLESSHGKLIYKKNIVVHNLEGMEFGYTALVKNRILYGYNQTFYLNNTLINYGRWSADSLRSNSKEVTDFFGTFKLTIPEDEIRQNNSEDIGYGVGYFIGKIAFIGIICLIGGIVVFIIIKITNKINR
jgi:hypothetical protein